LVSKNVHRIAARCCAPALQSLTAAGICLHVCCEFTAGDWLVRNLL